LALTGSGFREFRRGVLGDERLRGRLREQLDPDRFAELCLSMAQDLGLRLERSELKPIPYVSAYHVGAKIAVPGYRDPTAPQGFIPIAFDPASRTVQWCDTTGVEFAEPFFEDTIRRCLNDPYRRLFRAWTGIEALAEAALQADRLSVAGLMFHTSRCGSTLACQMLRGLDGTVVLSEPPVIDQLLRAHGLDVSARARGLASLLAGLARRRSSSEQRIVIKLDAWATRDLAAIREALPATPWIFIYREPAAVIASHIRMPGRPGAPGLLPPELFGLDLDGAIALGREGYCAKVYETICWDALAELDRGGIPIDYDALPGAVFDQVLPHFALVASQADKTRMNASTTRDAKRPSQRFDPAQVAATTEAGRRAAQPGAHSTFELLRERSVPPARPAVRC
jgi:hypothetical protein